jgi:hypothetical protein
MLQTLYPWLSLHPPSGGRRGYDPALPDYGAPVASRSPITLEQTWFVREITA